MREAQSWPGVTASSRLCCRPGDCDLSLLGSTEGTVTCPCWAALLGQRGGAVSLEPEISLDHQGQVQGGRGGSVPDGCPLSVPALRARPL